MKDQATLSREERALERDREQQRRADQHFAHKPQAAHAVGRVRTMRNKAVAGMKPKMPHFDSKRPKATKQRTAADKAHARRAFVRVRWVQAKGKGHWAAHAKYLEREGAQKEGERGQGFDATGDGVSLVDKANEWQSAGDEKIFKMVLSPEDGDRLDLPDYTRRILARMEQQMGQKLEWAAIDHHNTAHPHVHVLIRGGHNLEIAPEMIRTGIREMAQDEATRDLGYRSDREIRQGLEREIPQRRFTELDRKIMKKVEHTSDGHAGGGRNLISEPPVDPVKDNTGYADRRQRVARLGALCEIGVAQKVGHMTWQLDDGWDKALKELEVLQTRSTMLLQHRELMTDSRSLPVVSKLEPGQRITGRVLGTGLDEGNDRSYILLEATDGRAHFIYQDNKIETARGDGQLNPGTLASIERRSFQKDGKDIQFTKVTDYGLEIPARGFTTAMKNDDERMQKALDDELAHKGASSEPPEAAASMVAVGFAGQWHRLLLERQRVLELEKARMRSRDTGKNSDFPDSGAIGNVPRGKGKGLE
ncbi:MAG: DUF3363 domain-containing protein [Acidithiobacillus sp.]|nr:DUF3363 domain-containing protein [Acidithiobacillus sp.]